MNELQKKWNGIFWLWKWDYAVRCLKGQVKEGVDKKEAYFLASRFLPVTPYGVGKGE